MRGKWIVVAGLLVLLVQAPAVEGLQDAIPGDGDGAAVSAADPLVLGLTPFATGFTRPIGVVGEAGNRLFVVEQPGVIKIVEANGSVQSTPFLDITERVNDTGNEGGLLGLALHPDFATNGVFFVNYITAVGGVHSRISKFATLNANQGDPNSEEIVLTIAQDFGNHNGGHILFGPDGYLYIPLGDGGGAGDPGDNAQDPTVLLGKVNRIDVDSGPGNPPDCVGTGTGSYTVPALNPLVDGPGGTCDEIWALGLRNPWRSSFDRLTGDFYIGDVGQNNWEEIDFQPAASAGGENYGWRCYEGNHPHNTTGCGPQSAYDGPIFEYANNGDGCSVTGGHVYRGAQYPGLVGRYLLTDYCTGNFWDLMPDGLGGWTGTKHTNLQGFGFVAFGENNDGELFVANLSDGTIYALSAIGGVLEETCDGKTATIVGSPGNDNIIGTNQHDVIVALAGDDESAPTAGNDAVCAGAGDDVVDAVEAGLGGDFYDGGDGIDAILWDTHTAGYVFNLLAGHVSNGVVTDVMRNFENLVGTQGDDDIYGTDDANSFVGFDGADFLKGRGGADSLYGGNGADILDGGAGEDHMEGNAGDDRLNGGSNQDTMLGGTGIDIMKGGQASDTMRGEDDGDRMLGNGGHDSMFGGAGNDVIDGGPGDDGLSGDDGVDRLNGRGGSDTIDGGPGNDRLFGGTGADVFYLATGDGIDVIFDWETGTDLIDFSGNASFNTFGDVSALARQTGANVTIGIPTDPNKIVIKSLLLADLDAADFVF